MGFCGRAWLVLAAVMVLMRGVSSSTAWTVLLAGRDGVSGLMRIFSKKAWLSSFLM